MTNKERVLEISKNLGLSHIGSCLSVLPILEEIYRKKKPEDIVIMDNAHAHLAHLVVINQHNKHTAINRILGDVIRLYGIHCDRRAGCDASGGSLGHSGIALGYALVNPKRKVYHIVSDGSIHEGSFAEYLRLVHDLKIKNIEIHANFNGYTAVQKVDLFYIEQWIKGFNIPITFYHTNNGLKKLQGLKGHYSIL